MLLAVDIGNTTTALGVFEGDKLRATWHTATDVHRMVDEYASLLLSLLNHKNINTSDIKDAAMCSVVPPLVATFEELFRRYPQGGPRPGASAAALRAIASPAAPAQFPAL